MGDREQVTSEQSDYDPALARKHADPSMWLPDGRVCRDCVSFAGCVRFFGCRAESVTCDWSPSRFWSRDPMVPGAKS